MKAVIRFRNSRWTAAPAWRRNAFAARIEEGEPRGPAHGSPVTPPLEG